MEKMFIILNRQIIIIRNLFLNCEKSITRNIFLYVQLFMIMMVYISTIFFNKTKKVSNIIYIIKNLSGNKKMNFELYLTQILFILMSLIKKFIMERIL